jgi:hypothetical protein
VVEFGFACRRGCFTQIIVATVEIDTPKIRWIRMSHISDTNRAFIANNGEWLFIAKSSLMNFEMIMYLIYLEIV